MPNLPGQLSREEKKYLLAVERGDLSTVKRLVERGGGGGRLIHRQKVGGEGGRKGGLVYCQMVKKIIDLLILICWFVPS